MLFSATILALLLGTAVSTPWYQKYRHQTGLNPFQQARSSLTQGFLCDTCVVGVEDVQSAIGENLDKIYGILNKTSLLCEYCPPEFQDQCFDFFQTEIPAVLEEFLSETPNDLCTEVGLCDKNATIQGMVMNNLRGNVARDRVIKRMLRRARDMQQKMIRLIMGSDYLCSSCLNFVKAAHVMLLDNETQHLVVEFLTPLCDYLPAQYKELCTVIVPTIPDLMTTIAIDVMVNSTCSEIGFCTPEVKDTVDVLSRLGLPDVLPMIVNGQSPFRFPGQPRPGRQNPPFMLPGRSQSRPQQYPVPNGNWPRPRKPQTPKPSVPSVPEENIPDLNLDDIFGNTQELLGKIPSLPEMPNMRLPSRIPEIPIFKLPRRMPGAKDRGQSKRNRGQKGRRSRSVADWRQAAESMLGQSEDITYEYVPDNIPDSGITIAEQGADENCELCKVALAAVDTWLQENAPEIQTKISKIVQPFCKMFPSPMEEDCVSDVNDFVATVIQKLVSQLQPEQVCTRVGVCSTQMEVPFNPSVEPIWNPRFP